MKKKVRICGLDEAGRGAWAGPLVAAAVILKLPYNQIALLAQTKIKDGKLLTKEKREKIYDALRQTETVIRVEIISTRSINNHGIGWANKEIFKRLIKKVEADDYIIDGKLNICVRKKTHLIRSVINADASIPEVILAGIVAKVERDMLMYALHERFPHFRWIRNAGYGTKAHQAALIKYRPTCEHRGVFVHTGLRHLYKT